MKLYVAYGSNLNVAQMGRRCPCAKVYGKGKLVNWELLFRGQKTNAHATIHRKKGSSVPVLVWEISERDERRLDAYEGYPSYYYKQNVMVDISGQKRRCMVYIMVPEMAGIGYPSQKYVETIYQGYKDCGFDLNYYENCLERAAGQIEIQ